MYLMYIAFHYNKTSLRKKKRYAPQKRNISHNNNLFYNNWSMQKAKIQSDTILIKYKRYISHYVGTYTN